MQKRNVSMEKYLQVSGLGPLCPTMCVLECVSLLFAYHSGVFCCYCLHLHNSGGDEGCISVVEQKGMIPRVKNLHGALWMGVIAM